MSGIKMTIKDLPVDLQAIIRRAWNPGAEREIRKDGDTWIMETALQHVEFIPAGKKFRMRVWGRHVDREKNKPVIDRVL